MFDNKVFCDFCKFKCDEEDFWYDEIEFRNDKKKGITHGTLLCRQNIEIKSLIATYYWNRRIKKKIIVDDCSELNKNNECKFFKPNLTYFMTRFFEKLFSFSKKQIVHVKPEQPIGIKKSAVEETVMRIISERLQLQLREITLDSRYEALSTDSLDLLELVMAFEDEFDIEIPDEIAESIKTVGETIKYLEEKINEKQLKQKI